jgi:hypothetical protein
MEQSWTLDEDIGNNWLLLKDCSIFWAGKGPKKL